MNVRLNREAFGTNETINERKGALYSIKGLQGRESKGFQSGIRRLWTTTIGR
jgi:hypothetical protein